MRISPPWHPGGNQHCVQQGGATLDFLRSWTLLVYIKRTSGRYVVPCAWCIVKPIVCVESMDLQHLSLMYVYALNGIIVSHPLLYNPADVFSSTCFSCPALQLMGSYCIRFERIGEKLIKSEEGAVGRTAVRILGLASLFAKQKHMTSQCAFNSMRMDWMMPPATTPSPSLSLILSKSRWMMLTPEYFVFFFCDSASVQADGAEYFVFSCEQSLFGADIYMQ